MTETMANFRCWSVESVRETVFSDIGMLPTDTDALFMAAHTPMELEHLRGTQTGDAGPGERQVLNALLATIGDTSRNTLIAVTGVSGAGKSHVVRWVHANLDKSDDRYHVLYVPKAVQTIRQLLKRIVEGLPGGGGAELMDRVDAAVGRATPGELRDRLLAEIRLALTWTLEQYPPHDGEDAEQAEERELRNSLLGTPDDQGKRRNGLADLLELPQVNRTLLRDGGLLQRFTDSVYQETSSRSDQQEGFTEKDLPLREPGMRRALREDKELIGLWNVIELRPEPALKLLGEAVQKATSWALGTRAHNGETLESLFRRSRQLLRSQGKELVLLFEDLVQFGLIDGELYDQFTTQPGDDMAPLRAVFAVTRDRYEELTETVRTRITHRFEVNPSLTVDRNVFVARYLNLTRLGRADVEKSWAEAVDRSGEWLRNACDTREGGAPCRFRDKCHAGFGTVEVPHLGEVGLYLYNEIALRRALKDPDKRTPREILDVCVTQELIEADKHIANGTYPHEGRVHDRFDFRVIRSPDEVLGKQVVGQPERLHRAAVLWGDEADLANLSPVVAEAFSISLPPKKDGASAPTLPKPLRSQPKAKPTPADTPGANPLAPLFQWQTGDPLPGPEADVYRRTLHKMVVERLDLDQDLFHTAGDGAGRVLLNSLFPSNAFVIDGATRGREPGKDKIRFELRRDTEDVKVMVAARWLAEHGSWSVQAEKWRPETELFDLMLALEDRLDRWADQVCERFRNEVGGRDVTRSAIGLRAVALLALGTSPNKLKTLDSVLTAKPQPQAAIAGWENVDSVARDALDAVSAVDMIATFAAVRQGDRGGPQLVDAVGLDIDLKAVLDRPFEYLRTIAYQDSEVAANVANAARKLVAAVDKAAATQIPQLREATAYLAAELGGHEPKAVAQAAREVGKLAIDNNFFRPAGAAAVEKFREAADVVERLPSTVPIPWSEDDDRSPADQVLAAQGWAGTALRAARALTILKETMNATQTECLRNDTMADHLEERRQAVRVALGDVRVTLAELDPPGADRG